MLPTDRRDPAFQVYSQLLSAVPGYTGQALRRAFYGAVLGRMPPGLVHPLGDCSLLARGEHRQGGVHRRARCMVGRAILRRARHDRVERSTFSRARNQHSFDDPTEASSQEQGGRFEHVRVGTNTWIGNGAIVLANVGARSRGRRGRRGRERPARRRDRPGQPRAGAQASRPRHAPVGARGMNLVAITHRTPFPPDKGDKIRTFHLLSRIAKWVSGVHPLRLRRAA